MTGRREQILEQVTTLVADGATVESACTRLGMQQHSLERLLRRAGRHDLWRRLNGSIRAQILADPLAARVYRVVAQYARMMLPIGGYAEARGYRDGATRAVIETCLALDAGARLRVSLVAAAGDLALDDVFGPDSGRGPLPVVDAE